MQVGGAAEHCARGAAEHCKGEGLLNMVQGGGAAELALTCYDGVSFIVEGTAEYLICVPLQCL